MVIILAILALLLLPSARFPIFPPTTSVSTSAVTGSQPISLTLKAVPGGVTQLLEYTGPFPVVISFSAQSGGTAPFTYLWNFGDETNSTDAAPVHTFPLNCPYRIQLRVTDAAGKVTGKVVVFDTFTSSSLASNSVICPAVGTAGISSVKQEGLAVAEKQLQVLVDGVKAASPTTGNSGYWWADLSSSLLPKPNGSTYTVSVAPLGISKTFLTVEGVRASPLSGVPGDSVVVEGRSYPPSTTVTVYLGGVSLGQAQSDPNGSFQANFSVPGVSPLTQIGLYQFTTSCPQLPGSCPVLGAQASFYITTGTVPLVSSPLFPWVLLLVAVVVIVLVYWYRRRRRRMARLTAPPPGEGTEAPAVPAPNQALR
jgi:PKD repeat protein